MGLMNLLMPPLRLHGKYISTKGIYSYKLAARQQYKRIGVVPLNVVNQIYKSVKSKEKARLLLKKQEWKSTNLFGSFGPAGFRLDKQRLPVLEIPDLTGFELKPYVSFNTPKVDKAQIPSNELPIKTK
jgi:large subunit ribosomal protein L41